MSFGMERGFEARAAMVLDVRRAGVRDLSVMRAIEQVPRETFAQHRFRDLANRNMNLPIGCGQTMPSPADLGRRLDALGVKPQHRALEVGVGSGYGAAVLSRLAREVVSLERYETLAIEAARRLSAHGFDNVMVLFADGLAPSRALGRFDRIILHVAVEEPPQPLLDALANDGVMVFSRLSPAVNGRRRARLMKVTRGADGALREMDLGPSRQAAAFPGTARVL